jgi:uncharacterized oxidoreductase
MTVTIEAKALEAFVADIFASAGCSKDEGGRIGRYLVSANLSGHDSHGVVRVPRYASQKKAGTVVADVTVDVVVDTPVIAVVDGKYGFGQTVTPQAIRIGIDKCRKNGLAAVTLRNAGHVGRVGDWAEMAAAEGQVSLHFLNTSGAQRVAPFGGRDRRLSTNPISIGVPVDDGDPVILDVTTSTVAEGKLMVAVNKGEQVPEGWIIDRDGAPTTDPKAFYDGGALLTVGAHKGSGLSIVTDLLAGAVSTGRSSDPDDPVLRNNMLSIYIAPAVYSPDGWVTAEARRFVDWVKASPPTTPGEPVLAPGDIERRTRAERLLNGVPLDDKTLADLLAAARSVGIDERRAMAMLA